MGIYGPNINGNVPKRKNIVRTDNAGILEKLCDLGGDIINNLHFDTRSYPMYRKSANQHLVDEPIAKEVLKFFLASANHNRDTGQANNWLKKCVKNRLANPHRDKVASKFSGQAK